MRQLVFLFVALFWSGTVLLAQSKVLSGKVTDESTGSPLAGVSVLVKGVATGTTTREDGSFQINARELLYQRSCH
jgi:hypothetical protein